MGDPRQVAIVGADVSLVVGLTMAMPEADVVGYAEPEELDREAVAAVVISAATTGECLDLAERLDAVDIPCLAIGDEPFDGAGSVEVFTRPLNRAALVDRLNAVLHAHDLPPAMSRSSRENDTTDDHPARGLLSLLWRSRPFGDDPGAHAPAPAEHAPDRASAVDESAVGAPLDDPASTDDPGPCLEGPADVQGAVEDEVAVTAENGNVSNADDEESDTVTEAEIVDAVEVVEPDAVEVVEPDAVENVENVENVEVDAVSSSRGEQTDLDVIDDDVEIAVTRAYVQGWAVLAADLAMSEDPDVLEVSAPDGQRCEEPGEETAKRAIDAGTSVPAEEKEKEKESGVADEQTAEDAEVAAAQAFFELNGPTPQESPERLVAHLTERLEAASAVIWEPDPDGHLAIRAAVGLGRLERRAWIPRSHVLATLLARGPSGAGHAVLETSDDGVVHLSPHDPRLRHVVGIGVGTNLALIVNRDSAPRLVVVAGEALVPDAFADALR